MSDFHPSTPNISAPGTPLCPSTPTTGAPGTPLPVLVIEDEPVLLSYFQAALRRGGVKSVGATSGSGAVSALESGEFAAIISDLRLPGGMDGAEIFAWVQRNRPRLSQRFLFITGDLQSPYAAEVRERTGATFLEKPFRAAHLLEAVKKILSDPIESPEGSAGDARGETIHV